MKDMAQWAADLRHAVGLLYKSPAFTAAALLTLVVAIAANTAIFSLVNAILIRPLPYPAPDRLAGVLTTFGPRAVKSVSDPVFTGIRTRSHLLELAAAYSASGPGVNLTGAGEPVHVSAAYVSRDYFELFGATAAVGRTFTGEEDRPGGPNVVILSAMLWARRFQADPHIVGRKIDLNNEPYTVIGVLRRTPLPEPPADAWMPLRVNPSSTNSVNYLRMAVRLKSGISFEAANGEMEGILSALHQEYPDLVHDTQGVRLVSLQSEITGDSREALYILLGAVGFVLLIACANIANLLLARAVARRKEFAIRAALGASRMRLIMQLLIESLVLAVVGGAFGLWLGRVALGAAVSLYAGPLPRSTEFLHGVPLDGAVAGFTAAVSIATGILFGLLPAFTAARTDLNTSLKQTAARGSTNFQQNASRAMLIIAETALAVVLLASAALLVRSFVSLRRARLGFDPDHIATMTTSLVGAGFSSTGQVSQLAGRILPALASIPGGGGAALSLSVPISSLATDMPFDIEGLPHPKPDGVDGDAEFRFVSPGFFDLFRIPIARGRGFQDSDRLNSLPVAIVNRAWERKFWPKGEVLGVRIVLGKLMGPVFENPPRTIVGVAGDVAEKGPRAGAIPIVYIPAAQVPDSMMAFTVQVMPLHWSVRYRGRLGTAEAEVRRAFLRADPDLPISNFESMNEIVRESSAPDSFNTALLSAFAAIALILASIGIYGVVSYSVEQRRQELGIRAALGATPADAWRLITADGMKLVAAGLLIGLGLAFVLTRLLKNLLYGVAAWDPLTFLAIALMLALSGFAACTIPAYRATRANPVTALRHE
jgi:putative ABC transport system permease protein